MRLTRRLVLLLSALALLALDAGRSIYARVGSATPTRLWSPDPSYATPIVWPPGSDLPADTPLGPRLYAQHCAICHGPQGRGNGPAAPSLHPRPRDLAGGIFKLKSVPGAKPPTQDDLRDTLRRGMPGTSMPGWDDVLSAEEINAVADFVLTLGPHKEWTPAAAAQGLPPDAWESASAESGRQLYDDLGCASCHGKQAQGDGASAKYLKDVWNQPDPARDLTAPWTFRGGNQPEAVYARIAHGMSGTPMPGYLDAAEPAEIASVVKYIQSIARTPPWTAGGPLDGEKASDAVQRGQYLVRAGMCGLCHTPVDAHGIYLADSHYLAGGMKIEAGAHGVFFSRNLTSDADTGLGTWSVEQIAVAIRSGHTPNRRLNFWAMPWMILGALTHEDATAIASYLKTLPAVRNRIPDPLHYGVIETVLRKLTYEWPALVPTRLAYFAGNYGASEASGRSRDAPQRWLIWIQLVVLVIGGLTFVLTPRPPAAIERSGGLGLLRLVFLIVLGLATVVVYRYPEVRFLPAATVIGAIDATIPPVPAEALASDHAPLLQRGRYLYRIASCAYCHNGNGAGGGKVNWTAFGTTWARNLTPDTTGLREWSDVAALRAMMSGVTQDGRAMHWQAMLWDHLSNFSLEDQHALLAYVRTLPSVDRPLPAPNPPQPGDCPGDTFWVGKTNFEAGCR